tara:strand:- start:284 stop:547 length:264 start_codon:yes stop_codon:yes gene_type:complete
MGLVAALTFQNPNDRASMSESLAIILDSRKATRQNLEVFQRFQTVSLKREVRLTDRVHRVNIHLKALRLTEVGPPLILFPQNRRLRR